MAFKSFHAKPSSTISSGTPLPLLILNSVLRFFQFVLAITVCGLYGVDLNAARKEDKYVDSKWAYAEVVGALSAVTALVYVIPKLKSYYAFGWDLILLYVLDLLPLKLKASINGDQYPMDRSVWDLRQPLHPRKRTGRSWDYADEERRVG